MIKTAADNLAPFLPLVIGQATEVGATEIGRWLLAFAAVAVIAHQIMGAVEKFRKLTAEKQAEKPVPSETYQTIEKCKILHEQTERAQAYTAANMSERMTGMSHKIEALKDNVNEQFQNVLRAIGRLEGGSHGENN